MSVINQMLKDLDKRQQATPTINGMPQTSTIAAKASGTQGLGWLVPVSLLALVVAGAWWWLSSMPQLTASDIPAPAAFAKVLTDEALSSEPAVENVADAVPAQPEEVLPSQPSEPSQPAAVSGAEVVPAQPEAILPSQLASQAGLTPATQSQATASQATEGQAAVVAQADGRMAVTEVRMSPAARAERAMTKARAAEEAGRMDEAVNFYAEALFLRSDRHDARRQLAALKYGQGKTDEAIRLLEAGQLAFPDEDSFSLLLARLWVERGELAKAQANLERIDDGSEYGHDKWLLLADIARSTQDNPLAERSYARLLAGGADRSAWWLGLAYAQDAQGKFTEAAESYRRALAGGELSQQARQFAQDRLMQLGGNQ